MKDPLDGKLTSYNFDEDVDVRSKVVLADVVIGALVLAVVGACVVVVVVVAFVGVGVVEVVSTAFLRLHKTFRE